MCTALNTLWFAQALVFLTLGIRLEVKLCFTRKLTILIKVIINLADPTLY